ncbi:MAG: methylenetetrahydrofolate reductase [Gaiellaceae bacterium]
MSRLEDAVAAGRFLVTAELLSVNGGGLDAVREHFAPYEEWVDAVNATDNTAAHAHASPLAVAIALRQLGMEPVMQLVCRDRNRLALQAEIVGAALHGIENICCLTGDDVTAGDEPEARRVFDLDAIQLLAVAESMRNGRYLSGRKLDPPPHFFLGAVENPQAPPLGHRVDRALKKVRAGARFLQLQVVFELAPLQRFMDEAVAKGLAERAAILPSICLVRSPKALRFIDENVPGISVPADVIERCERAADPEVECFEVACELADAARALPGVRGLHLISFRKEAGIARLCRRLAIPTRHERETVGNGSRVAV